MNTLDEEVAPRALAYSHPPRFMTDEQLRAHFGLTERALRMCRMTGGFPGRNALTNRTDSKLVDRFFDRLASIESSSNCDKSVADLENWN